MANILIVYSSIDGHTQKICQRLRQVIEQRSHQVTVVSVDEKPEVDLTVFDEIVVGGSVHYGKHSPLMVDFINKNRGILESKPNAFFSVNLVARKPEKSIPENNPYLQKFLKRITWKPKELAVFAGKIDYPSYSFFDRLIIQLIMLITKGPTDPKSVIEFTDWQQVESFGQRISEMK
ncbi:MAG: menaquinone-dependent protoporphyrinogen IX dehydrogenase [Methylomicrobium sp.]|nr:menaquinone-dependent protoporphyrinogen IX dehydrogenase [Methylomicrobium sp.]